MPTTENIIPEDDPRTGREEPENPHDIQFSNGVLDTRDCTFREHQADDGLVARLPYELPSVSNPAIRAEIE